MKKIKLGLRLNAYNRRKIAQAVVKAQMGQRIDNLNQELATLGREVYAALFDMYGICNLCADGQDVSTIMEGTLPTAPHITVTSADRTSIMNLEFGDVMPIPYAYQIGNVNNTLFADLPMFEERIMGLFPKSALVQKQADEIEQRITAYLETHKTLRTVIDEAPDLAAIIPDEYCEEQKEGLSLDSILRGDEDDTDTFDEVEEHDLEVEDEEAR
ncbi:hypothetical protein H5079_04660 [Pseudoalteromonas sp. SG44-5]|uniref:hypothetical protein n=1 Tax=Pseudoalteromonas sp. SG44-5 TaxID=2760960 RepID=UPI0015F7B055|nr:hypothetical protein [Pseudoalteromonas sp. SG44-5]MBB1404902.1 hypothetical protein [Pseudoalteromonas sp. SG44-5]